MADPETITDDPVTRERAAALRNAAEDAELVVAYYRTVKAAIPATLANRLTQDWQRARLWPEYPPEDDDE